MEPIMELDTKNCYIWKSPQLLVMLAKMKTISFFTRIWSQVSMSNSRLINFSLLNIILTWLSAPAERLDRIQQDYCRTVTDLSSKHFQIYVKRSAFNNQSPTYSPPVARFPTILRTEVAKRLLEPSRKGMVLGMILEFRMVLPLLTVLEHSQWQEMAMMQSVSISGS